MRQEYSYRVIWSQDDEEHVGLCTEFPSLSHLAPTQAEALEGIHDLVAAVCEDMEAAGEDLPKPQLDENKQFWDCLVIAGRLICSGECSASLPHLTGAPLRLSADVLVAD